MNQQKFDFISIILLGINTIIGSGIFLLPYQTYLLSGNQSVIIFIIDAFITLGLALMFAENASRFNEDGGPYLYAKQAFGPFIGFEVGLIKWIVTMIALASQANAFVLALQQLFPAIHQSWLSKIAICLLFLFLMFIQLKGIETTKYMNNIFTIAKIIPLILIISIGIFFITPDHFINHVATPSNQLGQASVLMFYGFAGFESLVVISGKVKNVQKNMPRAIIFTITFVSIIYLLIQIISIGILGNHLSTTPLPIQTMMIKIMGPVGGVLVSLGTLLSIIGITISLSFVGPYTATALAKDHLFSNIFKQEINNIPIWSIIITHTISLIIALSGSFTTLATISVIARFAQYIPTILAVIVFRKKLGPAPFTVKGGNIIPIITIVASIWFISQAKIIEIIAGFIGLIIGIPIYFIQQQKFKNIILPEE